MYRKNIKINSLSMYDFDKLEHTIYFLSSPEEAYTVPIRLSETGMWEWYSSATYRWYPEASEAQDEINNLYSSYLVEKMLKGE